MLGMLACVPAYAENLVQNHSFDNGYESWDVELGAQVNSGSLLIEGWKPPEDIHVADQKAVQCIPLEKAEEYSVYAKFRQDIVSENPYANRLEVIWKDTQDCSDGGQWGGYLQPAARTGWQMLGPNNLRPSLNARAVLISINQRDANPDEGAVFWDDIVFEPARRIKLYENLVANPGFDNTLSDWKWKTWKTRWEADHGHAEPGAAEVEAEATAPSASFTQCMWIGDRSLFTAAISFRRDYRSASGGNALFRLIWYAEPRCQGASRIAGQSAEARPHDFEWQRLKIDRVRAESSAQSVLIEVIQTARGNGRHVALWDDAYFAAVTSSASDR